jgi:hypothetical protein
MKKLLVLFIATWFSLVIMAQTNPIDAMFDKYSEREGFTLVSISGRMFSMFANSESDSKAANNVLNKLKSIRILSVEDSLLNIGLNFYTELSRKLDLRVYEELMLVKEGPDITRFLIQQKGEVITELLVITGGPGGNSLISIRGELDLRNISNLSKEMGIEDLEKLNKIERKEDKKSKNEK